VVMPCGGTAQLWSGGLNWGGGGGSAGRKFSTATVYKSFGRGRKENMGEGGSGKRGTDAGGWTFSAMCPGKRRVSRRVTERARKEKNRDTGVE